MPKLIVLLLALTACGGKEIYDICPGTKCDFPSDICVNMYPGKAYCVNGTWTNEWDGNKGCPVPASGKWNCGVSLPAPGDRGQPSWCHYYHFDCP